VANRSKKWRDAELIWERLHAEKPDNDQICTGYAESLHALRKFDQARPLIEIARQKRPNDAYNTVVEARIAIAQGRWRDAVENLKKAQVQHPNDNGIRMILNEAMMRSLLDQPDSDTDDTAPDTKLPSLGAESPKDRAGRLREIFSQFESLGSTCEFGLVQRHFGSEPLGLLRWSVLSPEQLINALQRDFEGVGEPNNTRLKVVRREWYTEDVNFGMGMHTFILENEQPEETIFPKICKRLSFLRKKLLDDLQSAEKLFVYKSEEAISESEIHQIFSLLRKRGNCSLLVVSLASEDQASGLVTELKEGLMHGCVKQFFDPKPHIEDWLKLCLKAHALWRTRDLVAS
jgi:tetratricopeptide (TPR) repeat protein